MSDTTDVVISVWHDRIWASHTHSGTGPWAVSREHDAGDEAECYSSRRTMAAAARDARAEAAALLDRESLRGLRQTEHPRGIVYHRPPTERDACEEWPYRPMSVLVATAD